MKRIYVCGPYSADNVLDVLQNIGMGESYSAMLFEKGYAPYCPWHNKNFAIQLWYSKLTVKQFYDFSLKWLEVSDALFVIPGWKQSKGTIAEIKIANKLNIPVFYTIEDLENWTKEK